MAYIGKQPLVGNYQKCDDITVVNGQAAYTLQVNSSNVVPQTATNMIVSLNGVIQAPIDSYTVSGSTITFDSNLVTGDVIDFIVILGDVLDIGTPTDGTVGLNQLSATGTKDATTFLRGDNTFASIETRIAWQSSIKTSDFSASSNEGYWVDTSSNTVTITFPSSASVGDTIELVDYARNWGTNKIIIDSNGLNYQGDPDNYIVEYDTSGQGLRVVYSGATKGWIPTSDEVSEDNPLEAYNVDFLVIAGGAGGGQGAGGGGGAGGYRTSYNSEASGGGGSSESALNVLTGTQYTVTVGSGGTASLNPGFPNDVTSKGGNGGNSVFGTITSIGGGGGGSANDTPDLKSGKSGGSGGGSSTNGTTVSGGAGTANQGFAGGSSAGGTYPNHSGGGGGGASAVGANATTTVAGNGGNGLASTITGSSVTRAGGGGGGGKDNPNTAGTGGTGGGGNGTVAGAGGGAGTTNTGSGGGGCVQFFNSGTGGSGIVILRMLTADYSGTTTGSPTVTTDGSDTILTYTGSGSYTA